MTITLLRWARLQKAGRDRMAALMAEIHSDSWWRLMDKLRAPYRRPPLTRFADTLFLQYMQSSKRGLRARLLLHAVRLCELFERREAW